jgi:hypothetical protein
MTFPQKRVLDQSNILFVLTLLLSLALVGLSGCSARAPEPPRAADGVLDLRDWDFKAHGPVNLSGEWDFYWNEAPGSALVLPLERQAVPFTVPNLSIPGRTV